jgi:hypothetical protein
VGGELTASPIHSAIHVCRERKQVGPSAELTRYIAGSRAEAARR